MTKEETRKNQCCGNTETIQSQNKEKNERNKKLISLAKFGDKNALNELFKSNEAYNVYIATRYIKCGVEFDDLLSLCRLGMLKAYNSFNDSKNSTFINYATTCMQNEINCYLRKLRNPTSELNTASLDEYFDDNFGNQATYIDTVLADDDEKTNPCNLYIEKEESHQLYEILLQLPERERRIIVGLWFEEKTQKEVAIELNLAQSYISRLEKKILNKMRLLIK